MGRYDDISPDDLRRQLVRFARLVLRHEEEGTLLDSVPDLMQFLGELRQMVFAYEVRGTRRSEASARRNNEASPPEGSGPSLSESLRVVNEAIERAKKLQEELERGLFADDSENG